MSLVSGSNEVDLVDPAPIVLYPIAAAAEFGVFDLSIEVFDQTSMTDALTEIGGIDITAAMVLVVVSLGGRYSRPTRSTARNTRATSSGVIAFALLAPLLHAVLPSFADLVASHDMIALGLTLLVGAALAYIAYTE